MVKCDNKNCYYCNKDNCMCDNDEVIKQYNNSVYVSIPDCNKHDNIVGYDRFGYEIYESGSEEYTKRVNEHDFKYSAY